MDPKEYYPTEITTVLTFPCRREMGIRKWLGKDVYTNPAERGTMAMPTTKPAMIHLTSGQQVRYQDGPHVCVRKVPEIIQGCRLLDSAGEQKQQVGELMERLESWFHTQSDLKDAYIGFGPSGMMLVVIQPEIAFDASLSLRLSQLEIDIANDSRFEMLQFNTIALPHPSEHDIAQFVSTVDLRPVDA